MSVLSPFLTGTFEPKKETGDLQNKILTAQLQIKEQELNYLKKQIHPHFLFNTLNTIYGLALKQSGHTPEIILKLSNLLDYILYQADKPRVSLNEEVEHIREYIELEKIRFQESLKVEFRVGDMDKQIVIAPMLLIPFVENAFKHGKIVDGYLQINIDIQLRESSLDFRIDNSIQMNDEIEIEKAKGLGLENFRKRLNLNYENNYKLENSIKGNWYSASLQIPDLNKINDD